MYWPGLYDELKDLIANCTTCLKSVPRSLHLISIMQAMKFPSTHGQNLLLISFTLKVTVIYSLWTTHLIFPIIRKLNSMTGKTIVHHMQSIFSKYGWPNTLVTDNGPCYTSKEFQTLLQSMSVHHLTSSPHYPQSNGLAEKYVGII